MRSFSSSRKASTARVVGETRVLSVSMMEMPVMEPPMTTRVGLSARPQRSSTWLRLMPSETSRLVGLAMQLPATVIKALFCIWPEVMARLRNTREHTPRVT